MRFMRAFLILMYDAAIAGGAFTLSLLIRYGGQLPDEAKYMALYGLSYSVMCFVAFYMFGLHRNMWRYTSARELLRLMAAVTLALLATGAILFFLTRLEGFPRSAFIIMWLLHIAMAAGPRVFIRLFHDRTFLRKKHPAALTHGIQNVLLIGANNETDMFIKEANRQHPKRFCVRGILDNDPTKKGRLIHDTPVIGPLHQLAHTLEMWEKRDAAIDIIVLTHHDRADQQEAIHLANARGIAVRKMPSVEDVASGETLTNLKPVQIEDLLGRDAVDLDMSAIEELVKKKTVFITGAGGSIGSEIARQVAARKPQTLILADHSELALYEIDNELARLHPKQARKTLLLDVKNEHDVNAALTQHTPDIIFHAAAYKHVPMVESNPLAGIENNLFGTATIAEAAYKHGVENVVIISTDKAVNPTNIMGATKRAAELYCQNLIRNPEKKQNTTKLMTVRFGNVLGSTGSVVPLFTRQIKEGGPVTVTHRETTRYFMTIPESVQLVLQAATLGKGGEVFMLDMGEPVKIWQMAEEMIRLSGLTPYKDIDIEEIGLRPGEKLFEELWYDEESMRRTQLEKIFLVNPVKLSHKELKEKMAAIQKACEHDDNAQAVAALSAFVPEYTPAKNSPFASHIKRLKEEK